jgi:peroxiredoxin Q/BCP
MLLHTPGGRMAISQKKFLLRALIVVLLAFITFTYIANRVPKPTIASAAGKPAPNFVLPDQDGRDFALSSQRGHKVLLMFYRGYWWPFCLGQLREFAQHSHEFESQNIHIVAVSSDDVEHARLVWSEKVDHKFPVLSDPGAKVISQYGLLHAKGHGEDDIAIRTAIFLDENGIEQWRRVSTSASDAPKVAEILGRINGKWSPPEGVNMKRLLNSTLLLFLLFAVNAVAQVPAIAFCKLDRDIDFKTVKPGDTVSLKLTRDLFYAGAVVLPSGTAISANVSEVKDANTVSLILDEARTKAGKQMKLMGIIAAVAAPKEDLTNDPLYGMNHSTEVSQHTQPGSGGLDPQASVGTSGAAAQTAILKGGNDPASNLTADSQGAIGISGLSLTWVLDKPPAMTVLTSKKKNFKLKSGTELLLRMAPPQPWVRKVKRADTRRYTPFLFR